MTEAVEKAVRWVFEVMTADMSRGIWHIYANLFLSPLSITNDQDVQFVLIFMTTLAVGLLPLLIVIQAMRLSAARAVGMNTMPPEVLVHRAITAVLACTGVSAIVWVLINFQASITGIFGELGLDLTLLKLLFAPPPMAGLGILMLVFFLLIGAILVTIQKAIISAELAAMLAFGPITGLSLLHGDSGFFNTWLRETASLILTPLVQLILTWLFLRKVVDFFTLMDVNGSEVAVPRLDAAWEARLLTFGYLWVIWKCPAWLRQFTYSGGHGDLLVQGAAATGRFVVMRKMLAATAKSIVPGGKS